MCLYLDTMNNLASDKTFYPHDVLIWWHAFSTGDLRADAITTMQMSLRERKKTSDQNADETYAPTAQSIVDVRCASQ